MRGSNHKVKDSLQKTLGILVLSKKINTKNGFANLIIVEVAGSSFFKRHRPAYYREASGCIIFFDITSRKSFENIEHWIMELKENVKSIDSDFSLVIVGNKLDLVLENPEKREVSFEDGTRLAQQKIQLSIMK